MTQQTGIGSQNNQSRRENAQRYFPACPVGTQSHTAWSLRQEVRHIQYDPTGDQSGTNTKWDFTTPHTKPAPALLWKSRVHLQSRAAPRSEASIFPGWEEWEEGFTCTAPELQKAKASFCCNVLPPHPSIWEHQYRNAAGRPEQPKQLVKAHLTLTSHNQNHEGQKSLSFFATAQGGANWPLPTGWCQLLSKENTSLRSVVDELQPGCAPGQGMRMWSAAGAGCWLPAGIP